VGERRDLRRLRDLGRIDQARPDQVVQDQVLGQRVAQDLMLIRAFDQHLEVGPDEDRVTDVEQSQVQPDRSEGTAGELNRASGPADGRGRGRLLVADRVGPRAGQRRAPGGSAIRRGTDGTGIAFTGDEEIHGVVWLVMLSVPVVNGTTRSRRPR
jgi:hypothetical protein